MERKKRKRVVINICRGTGVASTSFGRGKNRLMSVVCPPIAADDQSIFDDGGGFAEAEFANETPLPTPIQMEIIQDACPSNHYREKRKKEETVSNESREKYRRTLLCFKYLPPVESQNCSTCQKNRATHCCETCGKSRYFCQECIRSYHENLPPHRLLRFCPKVGFTEDDTVLLDQEGRPPLFPKLPVCTSKGCKTYVLEVLLIDYGGKDSFFSIIA